MPKTAKLAVVSGQNRTPEIVAEELMAAKKAEAEANRRRVELEEEFIAKTGFAKTEGSQTFNVGPFKVTVTAKLNRKATDMQAFVDACATLPEQLRPFKVKTEVDSTGIKYLMSNEPEMYRVIAPHLEVAPAKTALTIVRTE